MRKLFGVALAALAITAIPVISYAQGTTAAKPPAPATPKVAAPKLLTATGDAAAVATDSLEVKGKTASWTFVIDTKTEVWAKGASHKTLALKADGKTPMLTDFVKTGYAVTVTYHEVDGKKHADTIRVTAATVK